METIWNFRELAKDMTNVYGMKLKSHMIFRSGALHFASEDDIQALRKLDIKRIYDLRSDEEVKRSQETHGIEIINFDVGNTESATPMDHDFFVQVANSGAKNFMLYLYGKHLSHSPLLKPLMQKIINETEPFLFHCAAGKDRTGVVGALLMHVLGFNEDQIIFEYNQQDERTLPHGRASLKKDPTLTNEQIADLDALHIVDPAYIKAFLHEIKDSHGSLDNYIHQFLDIDDKQIEGFIHRYMISN